jgi:chromosome segregation ATPase
MALCGTYETLKQAFQDIIAPQLERINGQIEGLKVEMASLEKRMEEGFTSLRHEMQAGLSAAHSEIQSVRGEIQSVRGEIQSVRGEVHSLRNEMITSFSAVHSEIAATNKRLDDANDMRERLAVLEGKMSARTN